jgi:hypothetical protein
MIVSDRTDVFHKLMYDPALSAALPVVLGLGTQRGRSAAVFLSACEETGGTLVSVDVKDGGDISKSPNFIFAQSDSIAVPTAARQAPILSQSIDVVYVDTTRNREHLEKAVASWWRFIRPDGWLSCRGLTQARIERARAKDAMVLKEETEERVRFFIEFSVVKFKLLLFVNTLWLNWLGILRKWSEVGTPCHPPIFLPCRSIGARALYSARRATGSARSALKRLIIR